MITLKDPLAVSEIAKEYRVAGETVRRWIRAGQLKATRLGAGGSYRVWRRDLESFLVRVRGKD